MEKTKEKPKANAEKERLWEKNPEMTAVLLAALEENPESKDLTREQKLDVVDLALLEKRFHDPVWLTEAILNIKMQSISGKKHVEIPVSRPVLISSQAELDETLAAHRKWIEQVLQPTEPLGVGRANLKGNDLRAFNFDGVDLRSANLEGCDLRGCSFVTAKMSGCNLTGANLEGAILHKTKLRKAKLNGTNLSLVKAFGTDFRQILCEGTIWTGSELRDLIFDDSLPKKVKGSMNPVIVPEPEPTVALDTAPDSSEVGESQDEQGDDEPGAEAAHPDGQDSLGNTPQISAGEVEDDEEIGIVTYRNPRENEPDINL